MKTLGEYGMLHHLAVDGNINSALSLLEHIALSDPDKVDIEAIEYIQSAAREILTNLARGKKPKADEALLLVYPQRKAQHKEHAIRDNKIAWQYYGLKKQGVPGKEIRAQLEELHHRSQERIHSIWKKHKHLFKDELED